MKEVKLELEFKRYEVYEDKIRGVHRPKGLLAFSTTSKEYIESSKTPLFPLFFETSLLLQQLAHAPRRLTIPTHFHNLPNKLPVYVDVGDAFCRSQHSSQSKQKRGSALHAILHPPPRHSTQTTHTTKDKHRYITSTQTPQAGV
ncbi:MAG: hypothetical protein GU356_02500 [Pyrobaculum sp.]|nr:hypothetical protein [Pyrobaculum sp.]